MSIKEAPSGRWAGSLNRDISLLNAKSALQSQVRACVCPRLRVCACDVLSPQDILGILPKKLAAIVRDDHTWARLEQHKDLTKPITVFIVSFERFDASLSQVVRKWMQMKAESTARQHTHVLFCTSCPQLWRA